MDHIAQKYKQKRFLYIIGGLLGLSLVIIIHEFGHFLFAKLFGVSAPVFSIGFGPALIGIPIGTTTFQIALLPLGGYVEMNPEELAALPYVYKMIVVLAGVLFNFLFTYLVLFYFILQGKQKIIPVIEKITPDSPAQKAGLQEQDTIIAIDNTEINNNIDILLKKIISSPGETVTLTVKRQNVTHDISVTIGDNHPIFGPNHGWLGVEFKRITIKASSWWQSFKKGKHQLASTIQNIGRVTATFAKKEGRQGIVGPIGIIGIMGKSLAAGPQIFLSILAIISLNVGIFNLLPLPFLDGGRAFIYTIEAVAGPIPPAVLWYITLIFLFLFFLFISLVTKKDIRALRRKK